MVKKTSRVTPQHRHWYEDLPERDAPMDRAPKMVREDMNERDDIFLEVSRASALMRGGGVFFAFVSFFGGVFAVFAYVILFFPIEGNFNIPFVGMTISLPFFPFFFVLFYQI